MKKKNKIGENQLSKTQKILNLIFLTFIFLIMVLPMWNVVVISTSSALSAQESGLKLWWTDFSFEGFAYVFDVIKLARPFINSISVSITATFIQVFLSSLAGYILIQNDLPFKKAITSFILLTMMIPGDLTLISLYQLNKQLSLIDTYQGLIINGLVSGFSIMLMRNYFLTVPPSLRESSRIDGASEFKTFISVYVPISLPGIATISFLEFVGKWNSIMIPATITTDQEKFTLPLVIRNMIFNVSSTSGAQAAPDNAMMAAIIISTIPLVLVYIFAQRFLLSGMTLGASKE